MQYDAFKQAIIEAAQKRNIKAYEIYHQSNESVEVSVFQHEVNEFSSSVSGGICFRCLLDGHMGYASTEAMTEEAAEDLVRRAAENALVLENEDEEFLCEGGMTYRQPVIAKRPLPDVSRLTETALRGERALYDEDPAVTEGTSVTSATEKIGIDIFNSKGLDLHYESQAAIYMAGAVVTDGNEMANDYEIQAGAFEDIDVQKTGKKAVKSALSQLHPDLPPTGSYPVVFSAEAMVSLLRTFAPVFSSESAQRGLSRLQGKEGEKIASEAVTLIDDPFYEKSLMPIGFDAEGYPTRTKNVIENGKLLTLLYNRKTAAKAGKETTGNAAKAAYDKAVTVQPFTLYLKEGDCSEEELIKRAGNGVYINFLGGLHAGANVVSGDFSLQSGGYRIENGVKTTAVRSFTVAGNFYSLLQRITALSDQVELPGFGGITAYASPSVLVEGLSIAGKKA